MGDVADPAYIEYRMDWNREDVLHSLCAFANDIDNAGGGYIVAGAQMNPQTGYPVVYGLSPKTVGSLENELRKLLPYIAPGYLPEAAPMEYQGRTLFVIRAPGGTSRPYRARMTPGSKHNNEKAFYIRRHGETVKASVADAEELAEIGGNNPFDDRVNSRASLADLRMGRMLDFAAVIGSPLATSELSPLELASALKVIGGPLDAVRPINAGLMFFADDPADFFREAYIEVVQMADGTGRHMVEHTFRGPLDRQLTDALAYLRNNIVAQRVVRLDNQSETLRVSNYPFAAIEEALSNAVYHKSYQRPEPITVRIEPERLSVTSFPGPDRSITDEDLAANKMVARGYRNRRIGGMLRQLGLAKGRNTGVPTMLAALRENGSADPNFLTDPNRTFLAVEFSVHPAFSRRNPYGSDFVGQPDRAGFDFGTAHFPSAAIMRAPATETAIVRAAGFPQKPIHARTRRSRIQLRAEVPAVVGSQTLSQAEIASALGYARVNNTLREVVGELVEKGVMRRTTASPHDPNAKYKLV